MIRVPPPRMRTPSGHDIPIPESVFQGLQHVDAKIEGVRAEVAGLDGKIDKLTLAVSKIAASKRHDWAKIIGALGVAVPAIVGGVRLSMPAQEPTRVEVVHTPIDPRMAECRALQPGTQAQAECFARVQVEIQSGKPAAP